MKASKQDELFQASKTISAAVGRVNDLLVTLKRGDVLLWADVEAATGFDRDHSHWSSFIKRLRKMVLEGRGIWVEAVPGVGLRLMTTDEQITKRGNLRLRKALRQLTRDRAELQHTPDAELTHFQRQQKYGRIGQTTAMRKRVLAGKRAADAMSRPTTTNIPQRPRPVPVATCVDNAPGLCKRSPG